MPEAPTKAKSEKDPSIPLDEALRIVGRHLLGPSESSEEADETDENVTTPREIYIETLIRFSPVTTMIRPENEALYVDKHGQPVTDEKDRAQITEAIKNATKLLSEHGIQIFEQLRTQCEIVTVEALPENGGGHQLRLIGVTGDKGLVIGNKYPKTIQSIMFWMKRLGFPLPERHEKGAIKKARGKMARVVARTIAGPEEEE